jgi:hypothetical protein
MNNIKWLFWVFPVLFFSCTDRPGYTADGLPLSTDSAVNGLYPDKKSVVDTASPVQTKE